MTTSSGRLKYPMQSTHKLSSYFGWRIHPISKDRRFHSGLDFRASTGEPVIAATSGQVVYANWNGGYGKIVKIVNGNNTSERTSYAHLSEIRVSSGDRIKVGQVIGLVGSTGSSTGPHLHFEFEEKSNNGEWRPIDPAPSLFRTNNSPSKKPLRSPLPSCNVSLIGDCELDVD